jgi:hypothetical protein
MVLLEGPYEAEQACYPVSKIPVVLVWMFLPASEFEG